MRMRSRLFSGVGLAVAAVPGTVSGLDAESSEIGSTRNTSVASGCCKCIFCQGVRGRLLAVAMNSSEFAGGDLPASLDGVAGGTILRLGLSQGFQARPCGGRLLISHNK
jgi:hypothetical protein